MDALDVFKANVNYVILSTPISMTENNKHVFMLFIDLAYNMMV